MQRLVTYLLAMGYVGTSAILVQKDMAARKTQSVDLRQADDAAFRDGLYLGRLARSAQSPMHPPVARWSTENDFASFIAGYRQGYNEQNEE